MTRLPEAIAIAVLASGLVACGSPPKERFYTLSETAAAEMPALPSLDYSVVVGPVTVPDIVDRPQLVLRMSEAEVRLTEQALWAEPLKYAIARAVAQNLAQALDNARVSPYPQGPSGEPDYRVALDVHRFDSVLGEAATIEVMWTVRRVKTGEQQTGRVRMKEAVAGQSYRDLVAAHVRAIGGFSRNISKAIQTTRQNAISQTETPQGAVGKTQ
jgi:uncharacterized lipoprotein YmbA